MGRLRLDFERIAEITDNYKVAFPAVSANVGLSQGGKYRFKDKPAALKYLLYMADAPVLDHALDREKNGPICVPHMVLTAFEHGVNTTEGVAKIKQAIRNKQHLEATDKALWYALPLIPRIHLAIAYVISRCLNEPDSFSTAVIFAIVPHELPHKTVPHANILIISKTGNGIHIDSFDPNRKTNSVIDKIILEHSKVLSDLLYELNIVNNGRIEVSVDVVSSGIQQDVGEEIRDCRSSSEKCYGTEVLARSMRAYPICSAVALFVVRKYVKERMADDTFRKFETKLHEQLVGDKSPSAGSDKFRNKFRSELEAYIKHLAYFVKEHYASDMSILLSKWLSDTNISWATIEHGDKRHGGIEVNWSSVVPIVPVPVPVVPVHTKP